MMFSQLILSSSSTDPTTYLTSLNTSTTTASFKPHSPNRHCSALLHSPSSSSSTCTHPAGFISVSGAIITVWSWSKDQALMKFNAPEKLTSIGVTKSGMYAVAGVDNGRIYVWEVNSGNLMKTFEPHYKKVSVLKFTEDDVFLISGADDAVVHVWALEDLLDDSHGSVNAIYSFTEHSLPITDIVLSKSPYQASRMFSSSLDGTVKIYDLTTGQTSATLLFPSAVHCITLSFCETTIFAGCLDTNIYGTNLSVKSTSSFGVTLVSVSSAPSSTPDLNQPSNLSDTTSTSTFRSHDHPITVLTTTPTNLISGDQSGVIHIWDIPSRQSIKQLTNLKGPVSTLEFIVKPWELETSSTFGGSGILVRPFKKFKIEKEMGIDNARDDGASVWINGGDDEAEPVVSEEDIKMEKLQRVVTEMETNPESHTAVADLQNELVRLYGYYNKMKGMNDELWNLVVDKIGVDLLQK